MSLQSARMAKPSQMVGSSQKTQVLHQSDLAIFAGIADLSLGAWRPRDVARQLAEQIGLPLDRFVAAPRQHGDIIARGVDNEAAGPVRVLDAFADAQWIANAFGAGARILLLPPRFADPGVVADTPFVHFLAKLGVDVTWRTQSLPLPAPCHTETLTPNQQALLAFFPGALPSALIRKAGLHDNPGAFADPQRGLIHPALRDADPAKSPGRVAALAPYLGADPRITLIYHLYGPAFYADADQLTEMGLDLCQNGEFDGGAVLLERAAAIARTKIGKAVCNLHLQGHRIYEHRFADAAAQALPDADLPPDLAAKLALTIAWGKIFDGAPAAGLALLEQHVTAALQIPEATTDALFLLNIAALGHLRIGAPDMAYRLEKEIETRVLQADQPDARALFINSINLARLCKRRGEPLEYRSYLNRAFRTSDGVRNKSEMLQMNLMRGNFGVDAQGAATYLLRAALIWLALDPPESISIRAQQALTFKPLKFQHIEPELSGAILERLSAGWPDVACDPSGRAFDFAAVSSLEVPPGSVALGHPELCLFWAPSERPPQFASDQRRRLATLVSGILRAIFPMSDAVDQGRVLLNFDVGQDLPAGRSGLLAMMARCQISDGVWNGQPLTFAFTDADHPTEHVIKISLAAGVLDVSDKDVTFRRSLAPRRLSVAECGIVAGLINGPVSHDNLATQLGRPTQQVVWQCRQLENDHVVRIEVADA